MAIAEPHASSSSLASDKAVRPFLAPTFDPVDYLNAVLPSWTPGRPISSTTPSTAASATMTASISDLATQSTALLAQLSAQLTRLSALLTRLTDDILRAGGRLAYEVEVLRGDAGGLHETLTEGLRSDIERFVPGGIGLAARDHGVNGARARGRSRGGSLTLGGSSMIDDKDVWAGDIESAGTRRIARGTGPELQQLRTLALVRDRLESVIKVFGAAIEWVVPPSEVSVKSSLISVSAPEAGSGDRTLREEKGMAYSEKVQGEIGELAGPDGEGAHAALQRIEQLRELAEVWKGTSEEKARLRFVDILTKIVEDRKRSQSKDTAGNTASGYRYRIDSQARTSAAKR